MYRPSQSTQKSLNTIHVGLPCLTSIMQSDVRKNPTDANTIHGNSMANCSFQYTQSTAPHTIVSSQLLPKQKSRSNSSSTVYSQTVEYIKFKKLSFYEVIENIINPTQLTSLHKCSLENAPAGMSESRFTLTLSSEQATIIGLNRDISNGKKLYPYQCQIRICKIETGCNEVTDYFPKGLSIRIENKNCPLPPFPRNIRPGFQNRRTAGPINCTLQLLLSPIISNSIVINWIPDNNNYVFAMFIVKKISVDTLIQKLKDKKARSTEETKNYIIKKLENFDSDLTVTHDNFSLICPLSKIRMKIPSKSIYCDHLQCFDAETFILMNERKPTWKCPICKNSCFYDDIQVENYFLDVLTSSRLTDNDKEILLCADGSWKNISKENMNNNLDTKLNIIDSVNLDSDDEKSIELINEPEAGGSEYQQSENFKSYFVDLTSDDDI